MVNSNSDALGIIFPNSYDALVPELVSERLMASIPFASRYRLVDFVLSSMVNCGIDNISLIVRKNYHSLMDHLGSGREWDLVRKNGGLNIVPPFANRHVKVYNGRVEALASILHFMRAQKQKYVIMSDANIAMNFDFGALIKAHMKSEADVTLVYREEETPASLVANRESTESMYYTFDIDESGRVTKIKTNSADAGVQNQYMSIAIIEREKLIDMITDGHIQGLIYLERDILANHLEDIRVSAYKYEGYAARITDVQSYFRENMKMLDEENLDALFSGPIYTKIRDDNPTRYIAGAKVSNTMAADGCVIEGEVENSVLFRGVKIAKGAKVKNCVLMQDTVVGEGANLEYMITDKNVTITANKELRGSDSFPVYVMKKQTV